MKTAPFVHVAAETTADAVRLLQEHGDDARILAGGQSLLALMRLRLAQPGVLVDIARCGLDDITLSGDLQIGAMVTQTAALESAVVERRAPLLRRALSDVAHHAIRNRGTMGGTVAHADPAAEIPAVLVALDASVETLGPADVARSIRAEDFFVSHYTTALEEAEVVSGMRIPAQAPDAWAFHEIARRRGDYALAGVAATFTISDGVVSASRVVLFAVDARPVRVASAEEALRGLPLGDAVAAQAAATAAAEAVEPSGDIHGSTEYRRRLVAVAVRRALASATTTHGRAA